MDAKNFLWDLSCSSLSLLSNRLDGFTSRLISGFCSDLGLDFSDRDTLRDDLGVASNNCALVCINLDVFINAHEVSIEDISLEKGTGEECAVGTKNILFHTSFSLSDSTTIDGVGRVWFVWSKSLFLQFLKVLFICFLLSG